MNVDWFVLKLVNRLRKICGWSVRQPLRGPPKALAGEGAPKGRGGPEPCSFPTGRSPRVWPRREPWAQRSVAQIQTHSPITWNDTFIGVS